MMPKIAIAGLMLACTAVAGAQSKAGATGRWKGESICTVKPSTCHDEVVVYDISPSTEKTGMLLWKADKIVGGEQQNMGTLDCSYSDAESTVTCDMPGKGVWKLTVRGDTMSGTLKLSDGSLFRKVSAKRVR